MALPTETFFNWNLFLPQKSPLGLLTQGVSSTNDLSALFIWLIILFFSLMAWWLIWRVIQARRLMRALGDLLEQADSQQLFQQRRELRQIAEENPLLFRLWQAFDASWVESEDGQHLYQTQDAANFFNMHTLAVGVAGNRLLMAMPGILTAFGILGTFVGLQIGLSTLDLSSPQVLSSSIVPLIQGAAVAFATSVWGTVASVGFNFLEKSTEQGLTRQTHRLQQQANDLFRQHLPEQTLMNIERASVEAENTLKGLAEQIGDKMQEVLLEMPQHIQASIEASMTPAIEKLVAATESLAERQGDSHQEALTQLIEQFVNTVSASGESSRAGMESASEQLAQSIANWGSTMEQFLGRLDNRATAFDSQMGHLLDQGQSLREESSISQQAFSDISGEMKNASVLLNQSTNHLQTLGEHLTQGARLLGQTQVDAAKLTEDSSRRQQQVTEMLDTIATTLEKANEGLVSSSQRLKESADITQASTEMAKAGFDSINESQQEFLDNLKKILTHLRKQVGQMMNDYATDVEEQTRHRMEQWNAHTQEFSKGMVAAVNAMSEILGEIDSLLMKNKR